MKILIIQDTDWIRRNPYQHTHLAERLVQKGHEIRVIDYEILWKDEGKKELLSKREVHHVSRIFPDVNIMVIRPPILKISILDYFSMVFTYRSEINRQIKEFKPDLIWGNDILTTFLAYRAAKKNRISTLFYSIDIDYRLIPQKILQPIGKLIESWNIRNADLVLSINEGLREYTIRMGANFNRTDVIRAGIDLERYDSSKFSGDEIRKQYGIAKDDIIIFFMGWLYHFSGLKEVAEGLPGIKDQFPQLKLFIVGDGDAYEDLKKTRTNLHLEENMILVGKQPFSKIPSFIAAADICLLPAYVNEIMHDIVPIKMYEYLAMGKPIVSTKLYGVMKEFGKENGIVYADQSKDVLGKVIALMKNKSMKSEGDKGKKFVCNNSWNSITDIFEKHIEDLL
nr:glycosyltransferase family 4 protein [uncultured Methanospirillum sp.]